MNKSEDNKETSEERLTLKQLTTGIKYPTCKPGTSMTENDQTQAK